MYSSVMAVQMINLAARLLDDGDDDTPEDAGNPIANIGLQADTFEADRQ